MIPGSRGQEHVEDIRRIRGEFPTRRRRGSEQREISGMREAGDMVERFKYLGVRWRVIMERQEW